MSVVCALSALSVVSAALLPPLPPLLDESVEVALVLESVALTVVEPVLDPELELEPELEPVADAVLLRAEVAAAALYDVVENEQERRISYASRGSS